MSVLIAPSILAADFAHLADDIARIEQAGADWLHVDVMDGHFVPNLTIGPPVVEAIKRVTGLPLDVHLMITDPDRYVDVFVESGASMVSVHVEACRDLPRTLARLRDLGARAGVALNPSTPVSAVAAAAPLVDHLLVMSVVPGFTGQEFLPGSTRKVEEARLLLDRENPAATVEVDGGVGTDNAADLVRAGATMLVAGAAIFHAADCAAALGALRTAAQA
jgi:ribulose-phosphate 3-epimerase